MAGHWFEKVQWTPPTRENYEWLRVLFNSKGGSHLKREYDDLKREYDDLKREYDDLKREYDDPKREYESLRRPFSVTKAVPYNGVWRFPRTKTKKGRHPCEKPQELLKHIVSASSLPGSVVLDCFMGSGATGIACGELGRKFIGIELSDHWFEHARGRLDVIEKSA